MDLIVVCPRNRYLIQNERTYSDTENFFAQVMNNYVENDTLHIIITLGFKM